MWRWGDIVLDHLSLQFDGADILMKPFPSGFKSSAESAIKERTVYKVNLVEKMHSFFIDGIIRDATAVGRYSQPPPTSVLYEQRNCILLAIYRLVADEDLYNMFCEVAMCSPLDVNPLRPYRECVDYTRRGGLAHVDVQCLKIGGKYLIRADGRSSEPRIISMHINQDPIATVSTSTAMYRHHMSAIKDILLNAVDKPLVSEYGDPKRQNSAGRQNSAKDASIMILNLRAGCL